MRRLSLVAVSLALLGPLLSQTALARSIAMRADLPDLPVCAEPCFREAVASTGCSPEDRTCVCDSNTFWQTALSCVVQSQCKSSDVSGLLKFGVAYCDRKRTGTNTAQRLGGAGKQSDTSAALSPATSVETVEPASLPSPEPAYTPPPEPVYIYTTSTPSSPISPPPYTPAPAPAPSPATFQVLSSVSSSVSLEPSPVTEDASAPELHVATTLPVSTTLVESISSSTSIASPSTSTFAQETTSSVKIAKVTTSSIIAAVAPSPEDSTTPVVSQQPSSETDGPGSDIFVIQTANPSTRTAKGQVTDTPAKTSAPPVATADESSSASVGTLRTLNHSIFASFVVCLLAIFFLH
ncbi:hypothetical protein TWF696_000426 [Orbilia brochopaga]|uniref:CFEM domain-containing protein n=1 Tax=Orbilia brochopaga TaxID=3140254 RepID=A0AAV9VCI0_9PEZI